MTAPEEGPARGERTRAHAEALAEMYRAVRDALLSRDRGMGPGCWTALHWQATYESPTADPRAKVSALVHLLGELVALVDAWCEQVDVAVLPDKPNGGSNGGPPEPENPAAVAQCITDVAGWFERSARALLVGAVELKYLAAELERAASVRRGELAGAGAVRRGKPAGA